MNIRRAKESDIPFLIETIIQAEKSGTNKLSYSTIFSIEETEFRNVLKNILNEDIEGQELCVSGFLIAENDNNEAMGAICGWIEAEEGISSKILKANVLLHFLSKENLQSAIQKSHLLEQINFERQAGALQIESVYTNNKFRGKGVSRQLILEHIRRAYNKLGEEGIIQILVAKNNESALKAYEKTGFKIIGEKTCNDPAILEWVPSDTRVLMQASIKELKVKLL